MYAVINAGGKQERVEVGELVDVELLDASPGDELTLTPLMVVDGDEVTGVIDWSEAAPGDAMFDLATWTLVHEERLDDLLAGYGGGG